MSSTMQMRAAVAERSGRPPLAPKVSRETLLTEAARWDAEAREAVARGAIAEAGLLVLRALDCERRVRASGPQVLGVIRRRNPVPAGR
jgi:hypothetical protein